MGLKSDLCGTPSLCYYTILQGFYSNYSIFIVFINTSPVQMSNTFKSQYVKILYFFVNSQKRVTLYQNVKDKIKKIIKSLLPLKIEYLNNALSVSPGRTRNTA